MITINIVGRGELRLEHLVLDVNGTLAIDGELIPGVANTLMLLSERIEVHLITSDTHGRQREIDAILPYDTHILSDPDRPAAPDKLAFIRSLGARSVVAIGNGANDADMLGGAAIGVCIVGTEGAASVSMAAADCCVPSIHDAFNLLLHPKRMESTLRA